MIRHGLILLTALNLISCTSKQTKPIDDVIVLSDVGHQTFVSSEHWLSTAPDSMQPLYEQVMTGDWQKVITKAQATLKQKPFDVASLLTIAIAHYHLNNFAKSKYFANLVLKTNPNHTGSLNVLGLVTQKQAQHLMDYRLADQFFSKALQNSPKEIAAGLNLGFLRLNLGDNQSALEVFDKLADRCPGCFQINTGRGVALSRLGKLEEAHKALAKAIKQNPKNSTALFQLALVLHKKKEFQQSNLTLGKITSTDHYELLEKARALQRQNESYL